MLDYAGRVDIEGAPTCRKRVANLRRCGFEVIGQVVFTPRMHARPNRFPISIILKFVEKDANHLGCVPSNHTDNDDFW